MVNVLDVGTIVPDTNVAVAPVGPIIVVFPVLELRTVTLPVFVASPKVTLDNNVRVSLLPFAVNPLVTPLVKVRSLITPEAEMSLKYPLDHCSEEDPKSLVWLALGTIFAVVVTPVILTVEPKVAAAALWKLPDAP